MYGKIQIQLNKAGADSIASGSVNFPNPQGPKEIDNDSAYMGEFTSLPWNDPKILLQH